MDDDIEPADKWSNEWTEWRSRQLKREADARDAELVAELQAIAEPALPAIERAMAIGSDVGEREPTLAERAALAANLHAMVNAMARREPGSHLSVVPPDESDTDSLRQPTET